MGSRGRAFESPHSDQKRIIRTVSSRWEMRSDFSFCMKSWMSTHKNRRDCILPIRAPPVAVLVVFGVFGVLFSLPLFKGRLPFCTFIKPLDLRQKDSGQCFHFKSWNPGPAIKVWDGLGSKSAFSLRLLFDPAFFRERRSSLRRNIVPPQWPWRQNML